jgi:hypothetical protein
MKRKERQMGEKILQALALRPDVELRNLEDTQWAHVEELLTGTECTAEDMSLGIQVFIPQRSTAVVGVFDAGVLWASLVVSVDSSGTHVSVTTMDSGDLELRGDLGARAGQAVQWVQAHSSSRRYPLLWRPPSPERSLLTYK